MMKLTRSGPGASTRPTLVPTEVTSGSKTGTVGRPTSAAIRSLSTPMTGLAGLDEVEDHPLRRVGVVAQNVQRRRDGRMKLAEDAKPAVAEAFPRLVSGQDAAHDAGPPTTAAEDEAGGHE